MTSTSSPATPETRRTRSLNGLTLLMAAAIVLLWFSSYVYVPILSTYSETVGADHALIGLILGSYGFVQMIMRIPIGLASDKWGNRRFFLYAAFGVALLSALGFYFFPEARLFLLFRSLAGLSVSNWAIYMTAYQVVSPGDDGSRAIGIVSVYQAAGMLLGLFLGGFIADAGGPERTFLVSAVTSAIGFLLIFLIVQRRRSETMRARMAAGEQVAARDRSSAGTTPGNASSSTRAPSGFGRLLRNRRLIFYSLMTALMHVIFQSTQLGFMPTVLARIGADDASIGMATTLGSLPALFGGPLAIGPMKRKFGADGTAAIGFFLMAVGTLPFMYTTSLPLLMFLALIGGIGKGILAPLLMAESVEGVPPRVRATALSIHQAVYSIGMSAGPAITGAISKHASMTAAYIVLTVTGGVSTVIFLWLALRRRRTSAA